MYASIFAKHFMIHYFVGCRSSSLTSREDHTGVGEENGIIFGPNWEVLTVKDCPMT
jgi:hypothetical protein